MREHRVRFQGQCKITITVATGVPSRVVVERRRLLRFGNGYIQFPKGSAVLLPGPGSLGRHCFAALGAVAVHLSKSPQDELVLIGHASPEGSNSANTRLSRNRAQAVADLIRNDTDAFVDRATDFSSLSDIKRYLGYLASERGWDCDPGPAEGAEESHESREGVSGFQRRFNLEFGGSLDDDGVCGEKTLGGIFKVARSELIEALQFSGANIDDLRADAVKVIAAASDWTQGESGPRGLESSRAVDLLVAPAQDFSQGEALSAEDVYGQNLTQIEEILSPPVPLGDFSNGRISLLTDTTLSEDRIVEFVLTSSSGVTQRRQSSAASASSNGQEIFVFDSVNKRAKYTLGAVRSEGEVQTIFEDVPYLELCHVTPTTRLVDESGVPLSGHPARKGDGDD